jgi:hypothetical protein
MYPEFHPPANIFPLLKAQPFDELVDGIKVNGLYEASRWGPEFPHITIRCIASVVGRPSVGLTSTSV